MTHNFINHVIVTELQTTILSIFMIPRKFKLFITYYTLYIVIETDGPDKTLHSVAVYLKSLYTFIYT